MGQQIIAVSEAVKENLIAAYKISPQRIKVVKMGLLINPQDEIVSWASLRNKLNLDSSGPFIGCIGRLSPEKGQIYLLRAIPEVLQQFPLARFLFIGDGPDRYKLESSAKELGINGRVIFGGWRNDVDQLIGLLDLVVIPSITEGLPLVALEALEKKKALIASRVGGLPEVIKDMQTGLLVIPEDPASIQEAIILLLRNPELRRTLGENGYQFVRDQFSIDNMVDQTEKVYQALFLQR